MQVTGTKMTPKIHLNYIDGLRGIAVLAVLINHLNPSLLPGGYLGVDIFFVISGFVVPLSLSTKKFSSKASLLVSFYRRRIVRLTPPLAVVVLLTSLAITIVDPNPAQSLRTGIYSLVGLSNIYLSRQTVDYFDTSTDLNPFLHTWSLGVEEQFYLIYPFLYLCTSISQFKLPLLLRKATIYSISFLILSSLLLLLFRSGSSASATFYLTQYRLWELLLGTLAFIYYKRDSSKHRLVKEKHSTFNILQIIFFIIFLSALFLPYHLNILGRLTSAICTALFLAKPALISRLVRLASYKPLRTIGLYSYSIYLWHWPIISISSWLVDPSPSVYLFEIVLIALFSFLSYNLFESPAPRLSSSLVQPIRNVFSYSTNLFPWFLVKTLFYVGSISLLSTLSRSIFAFSNGLQLDRQSSDGFLAHPHWYEDPDPSVRETASCFVSEYSNEKAEHCLTTHDRSLPTIYLVGDSHAANYSFGLSKRFKELTEYQFRHFTISGCGYLSEDLASRYGARCTNYTKRVNDTLTNQLKDGDIVLLGMMFLQPGNTHSKNGLVELLDKTILDLSRITTKSNANLHILDDVPDLPEPSMCITRFAYFNPKNSCRISISHHHRSMKPLTNKINRLDPSGDNIQFTTTAPALCKLQNLTICTHSFDGKPLYFNKGHLTPYGSYLATDFLDRILSR